MPFDPKSPKKAGKKSKRGPAKKKDLPSKKRWKCFMKKYYLICV
jgi:hypothetical protein